MAKFFNSAASMISSALSKSPDPNQVREVSSSTYSSWPVRRREDCLLLHGPQLTVPAGQGDQAVTKLESYEIIVQSDTNIKNCFSLMRTHSVQEADRRFQVFSKILPHFLSARPELCNAGSLQKLSDCTRDHPDWGLVHIAVHLDMVDLVGTEDRFKVELDLKDSAGVTPIMLAVTANSKHLVSALVTLGASLQEGCDVVGSNVFHYVAPGSVAVLDILGAGESYSSEVMRLLLNSRNCDGNTPLHLACQADKTEMVKAMLCLGADVNTLQAGGEGDGPDGKSTGQEGCLSVKEVLELHPNGLYSKDMKLGGTPLHWATEKPLLAAMIKCGCNIEARNSQHQTALHIAVRHKRLSCTISLLSHGALVDSTDGEGNSALHLASITGHLPTLQALLVFRADFNLINKAGETPWSLALKTHQSKFAFNVEKERNMILHTLHSLGAEGPSDLGPTPKDFDWKPPVTDKTRLYKRCRHQFDEFLDNSAIYSDIKPGSNRILSLDGGGIKGLVLAKMLECLAEVSRQKITEMFDWITGTSTGGILSLALAVGKTPLECQSLYFKLKDEVFVGSRPYDVKPMEEFLKKEFSENLMMNQLPEKPLIAVTGTMADRYPADLHFFRNYTSPTDLLGMRDDLLPSMSPVKKPDQQTVWRAARSSGAAPTYFRASGRFIDGGLISNNPTLDILTEIHERNSALMALGRKEDTETIGLVLSLGTGDPPVQKVESIDLFRPDSIMGVTQLFYGVSAMGRLLVDQASSATNRVVDRARAWCSMANIAYMRLSPLLASDIALDETNDEVLVEMLWMTQAYMHEQRARLQQLVNVLNKK